VIVQDAGNDTPPSDNLGFASAVTEFDMLLRESAHKAGASYDQSSSWRAVIAVWMRTVIDPS
jgi:hypothetical protein